MFALKFIIVLNVLGLKKFTMQYTVSKKEIKKTSYFCPPVSARSPSWCLQYKIDLVIDGQL